MAPSEELASAGPKKSAPIAMALALALAVTAGVSAQTWDYANLRRGERTKVGCDQTDITATSGGAGPSSGRPQPASRAAP